jgi:hypothetical protein
MDETVHNGTFRKIEHFKVKGNCVWKYFYGHPFAAVEYL